MATDLGDWHSFEGSEAVDKQEKKVKLAHQKDIDSAVKEATVYEVTRLHVLLAPYDVNDEIADMLLDRQAYLEDESCRAHATEVLPDDPSRAKTEPTESKPGRQLEKEL